MEFMFFVVIVLSCVVIGLLSGIRSSLKTMQMDQQSLAARLDSIKNAISKGITPQPAEQIPKPAQKAAPEPKAAEPVKVQPASPAPVQKTPTSVPAAMPKAVPAPVIRTEPVAAKPAKPPSKFAQSVSEILTGIWNWILVGEEHRPSSVTAEYAVASVWLLRLGVVAIVACLGYFLKWSIDREYIGPAARVVMSAFTGIGLAIWGVKLLGRKYNVIGQGLIGGGLAIMYFTAYATGQMYHLFDENSIPVAFGLMILITAASGVLAVRTNSLLIAVLGLIGGYCTPIMLRTPTPNLAALYAYMLLLGIGILAIANYRQWRLLNYLCFVFTYALFLGSMSVYTKADFTLAMSFLAAFFVLHSSLSFINNLVRRKPSTTLEVIQAVANAAVFSAIAYNLIDDVYRRPYPAIMSISLALFYMAHAVGFIKLRIQDRPMLISLLAMAGAFTTWTLPLAMEKESLTIALSLLGLMFLWLGRKLDSHFLQNLGHALYIAVFFRLLAMDLPRNFSHDAASAMSLADYWKVMSDRLVTFGSAIASIIAAFFIQRKSARSDQPTAMPAGTDTPEIVNPGIAAGLFYWFGILFAFLFLHLELNRMFGYWEPLRLPMLTVLWCVMACYFMWRYTSGGRSPLAFAAMCLFVVVGAVKIFVFDLQSWHFCDDLYFNMAYLPLYAGMRLLDFGVVLVTILAVWLVFSSRAQSDERRIASILGYGGLLMLFLYTSMELNSLLHWKLREFQTGGISVLWALFAIAFILSGIRKSVTLLRYLGLILFLVVICKVFFIDLRHMEAIYRVIAFAVVGVFLLLGSFAYIKSSRKFTTTGNTDGEQES